MTPHLRRCGLGLLWSGVALLSACKNTNPTVILVTLDVGPVASTASLFEIVVDPEYPFADASGRVLPAGPYSNNTRLDNIEPSDNSLELLIDGAVTDAGKPPTFELDAGKFDYRFDMWALARTPDAVVAQSDSAGPFEFTLHESQRVTLEVHDLAIPLTDCNDGEDNDTDGWLDAADPDCAAGGVHEVGTGKTACNDGTDNDDDTLVDVDDPDCVSADDNDERGPCKDEVDNDGDGWIDQDDPDCVTGDAELGVGATVCNDGKDNDGDKLTDALDPDCQDAADAFEDAPTCSDGEDNDGDGWVDDDDPDCGADDVEVGLGTTECNDGLQSDADGLIDADDPQCRDGYDDDEGS